MKSTIGLIIVAILIVTFFGFKDYQDPKLATLQLNKQEMEILLDAVDNSALPGQVRKPMVAKLANAYNAAFAPKPEGDTSKPKNNKP